MAHGQTLQGALDPRMVFSLLSASRQMAEFRVLGGLLALEEGKTASAARYFRQALNSGGGDSFDFPSRGVAFRYLQLIKEAGGDR